MTVSHIYLYVHSGVSTTDFDIQELAFVNAGYCAQNIKRADSLIDLALELERDCVIIVYELSTIESRDDLIAIFLLLQEKNIMLRFIKDSWVNLSIIDFINSVNNLTQSFVGVKKTEIK